MKLFRKKTQDPLSRFVYDTFGLLPKNLALYQKAFTHKSFDLNVPHNERLEYLGDAVLDLIVAELLFRSMPDMSEGELTKAKSRIVSRENLNRIGEQLNLIDHVRYFKGNNTYKSLEGNVFEAFIGALYLDQGFVKTKQAVEQLFHRLVDIRQVATTDTDYKSQVLIWCQKNQKKLRYDVTPVNSLKSRYLAQLFVDGEMVSESTGITKKEAEKEAARLFMKK